MPEELVTKIVTTEGRARKQAARVRETEGEESDLRDGAAFGSLYAERAIEDVIRPLKSGKEATVYLCRAPRGALVAAKVYKERVTARTGSVYDDGRQILDARMARAARKGSAFGREVDRYRWVEREFEQLRRLFDAGVAIPRPLAMSGGVILMEYVGSEADAAPRLRDVALGADAARSALRWVLYDVELMLGANVVHGDLSAFNILWWEGRTKIIDFPQAVDPRFNRNARALLDRDVANVCDYFARCGAPADANAIARDLWRRWMRAEL